MNDVRAPGTVAPADASPIDPVPSSTQDEVQAAVERARAAQVEWAKKSLDARSEVVMRFARQIATERAEGMRIMQLETGRGETENLMSEIAGIFEFAKGACRAARKALADEPVSINPLDYPGKKAVIEAVPRGVIGIIAPWNYPVGNFYKSFFPAVLAGNAVVLKPSEHTPRSGAWFAKIAKSVFGDGLVQLVQGTGEVGAWLIESGIDSVVFTGSVRTGKKVAAKAGELLIPCSVELGGKDAAIVLKDCNLERTAVGVAQWGIHNAGQNCAGIERVYVEESIADEFVKRLGKVVGQLRVAPADGPTDLGPLQNEAQFQIVQRHVEEAKKAGAEVVTGGEPTGIGFGYKPTVLDKCTDDMTVMREETFGPVLGVARVKDAEEAVRRANDCEFGLNGSVWTTDLAKGQQIARRLEVGVALVNNHALTGINPELPWTGVKNTGPGIASSIFAYPTFVRRRAVFVDKNKNPDPWWFPANQDLQAFGEALLARGMGSMTVIFKLIGLLSKRMKAIKKLVSA